MTIDGLVFWLIAIPATLLVLCSLVLVHEIGHFVTARLSNIKVLEFGIGFPPRAKVLREVGETQYTLNWLPIGGFVRMEGEDLNSDDPRSFTNAPFLGQAAVMVAGVLMNLVAAVLLFFVVAWLFNPGEVIKNVTIIPDSAAARAGLTDGATIESLNGQRYGFMTQDLLSAISDHAGQTVTIGYATPQGQHKSVAVTLGTDRSKGILGIRACPETTPKEQCRWDVGVTYSSMSIPDAAAKAVDQTATSLRLIFVALGQLGAHIATNPTQAPAGVAGPVGITEAVGLVLTDYGPVILLLLAAVLSANLALINILPIPPFDGGKLAIVVIKRVFGVKGVGAYEIATNLIGFVLLMAFLAWISFFDILRIGGGG